MDIVIRTEEDAWKWLEQALNGSITDQEITSLRFDGWPILELKFDGRDFSQSVPTRMMPPLIQAQIEINRIYCALVYGTHSTRNLKDAEREQLELNVKVKDGSSELETSLTDSLNNAFLAAIDKMPAHYVLIALLGGALFWCSLAAWKSWLNFKLAMREKDLDAADNAAASAERLEMSKLELKKLELLARSNVAAPETRLFSEGADDFRNDSLNRLKPSDKFEIPNSDFKINGELAAAITNDPRERSSEISMEGEFIILSVSSGEMRGYRLKVKRVLDGKEFYVSIPDGTISIEEQEILSTHEWAKHPIILQLQTRQKRGEISSATLVKAIGIERERH